MVDDRARRAQLEGYIVRSQRLQRRLIGVLPIGLAIAVAVRLLAPGWAWLAVLATVSFYGVGRYITATHIADWRALLRDLDHPPAVVQGRERDG
jgi:hypothetical protein